MWRNILFLSLMVLMVLMVAGASPVQASDRVHGVRVFLSNGDPDQAILTAKVLLKRQDVTTDERFELRKLIAYAEEMSAQAQHYEHIDRAIQALKALEKEFPQRVKKAPLHWRMIWLYWKHGDDTLALQYSRALRANYANQPEAMQAAMLMARIYIKQHKYHEARTNLMRYGLGAKEGSREAYLTKAWLAVVDAAEKRNAVAAKQLDEVYRYYPDIIRKDEYVYAVYIRVLKRVGREQEALNHAMHFLKTYIDGDEVLSIRLLRADLWAKLKTVPISRIEREYDVLAEKQAAYSIGKQAFMRKLMLLHEKSETYYELKPVIIALKRVAERNQLSNVENEAMYDLGVLWERLSRTDPEHAPKMAVFAALDDFSRVVRSDIADFRQAARQKGARLFNRLLKDLSEKKQWEKVVALWERYPHLRKQENMVKERAFEVAHALRMLMDYDQAESMLKKLYDGAKGTVWGQKIMLERANLWLERGDPDGVAKILAWLDEHEYTLYRPDMLLLVAQMQLQAGKPTAASQTLRSISVDDIALDGRANYWRIQAEVNEALNHWHVAAKAWQKYGQSQGSDADIALQRQADALFQAKKYRQAQALYAKVKEDKRDAAWRYHTAMCALHLEQADKALPELEKLKQDKDAGVYASLAAAELANRKALNLLGGKP